MLSVVVLLCTIIMFGSCQKDIIKEDAVLNSSAMSNSGASAKKLMNGFEAQPNRALHYGAFICPPTFGQGWLAFQQSVAEQLGVSCLRGSTWVPGNGLPPSIFYSGYDVLFNFNTNISSGRAKDDKDKDDTGKSEEEDDDSDVDEEEGENEWPRPFVKDLTQYKIDLNTNVLLCPQKPIVAVIENEESNRFYYSGSAWDYIKQLNAAIGVMRANGVKITNGGLTGGGLEYLVYQDFIRQGKEDSAKLFQNLTKVTPNSPTTQERGVFVDSLLLAYYQLDIDYVNFHWKVSKMDDVDALRQVITYLKKRCNKPLISNELGQYDKDPNTLLATIQLCTDMKMPFITWYSPDEKHSKKASPLQYDNASLTNTGTAYQQFLAD